MEVKRPQTLSRREMLALASRVAAAGPLTLAAASCGRAGPAAAVCSDPNLLTDPQITMRQSVKYTEVSTVANQACAGCSYYEAAASEECGACKLLTGPVNSRGRCNSWSAAAR